MPELSSSDQRFIISALLELERRLARSCRTFKQLHNMCSPVGHLSDELVLEVLRYCEFERDSSDGHGAMKIPVVFSLSVYSSQVTHGN